MGFFEERRKEINTEAVTEYEIVLGLLEEKFEKKKTQLQEEYAHELANSDGGIE